MLARLVAVTRYGSWPDPTTLLQVSPALLSLVLGMCLELESTGATPVALRPVCALVAWQYMITAPLLCN